MTYQFVEINGTKIHYEERGEGTAVSTNSGRAVILIHAGVVNLGMWDEQMEPLAEHYRVIRYDIRGWGETANPPGQYSDHEDLHGLLTYLGVETAVLIGCSMGGKIALDFTLVYPQMVAGLVLVGAGLGGYDFTMEGIIERAEAMNAAYERGEIDVAAEISTQVWYDGLKRTPEQVEGNGRAQIRKLIHHTFCVPEGSGKRQELTPPAIGCLAEIQAPTLIVVGGQDAPDIQQIAVLLQDGLPNARKVTLDDTAHFPNVEKPAEFNRLILGFLAETFEVSETSKV